MARKSTGKAPQQAATHTAGNAHHGGALPRLNRVSGQLEGIKNMIAQDRHCPEIIAQLRAARAALKRVEADILETHLNHCVTQAITSGNKNDSRRKIEELKDLFSRFDE